jgi:hypothetical protein
MKLTVHDHLRSTLGPDTQLNDIERFIYDSATSSTRGAADALMDKIVAYLDAAGTRDYVVGASGMPQQSRDSEVRDLYLQVLGSAKRLDRELQESNILVTVGDIRQLVNESHDVDETLKLVDMLETVVHSMVKAALRKDGEAFNQTSESYSNILWNLRKALR